MSDLIVLMVDGRAVEVGTPRDMYAEPARYRTAEFLGGGNVLEGLAVDDARFGDVMRVRLDFGGIVHGVAQDEFTNNDPVRLVVKPDDLQFEKVAAGATAEGRPVLTVADVAYYGARLLVTARPPGAVDRGREWVQGSGRVTAVSGADAEWRVGDLAAVSWSVTSARVFGKTEEERK